MFTIEVGFPFVPDVVKLLMFETVLLVNCSRPWCWMQMEVACLPAQSHISVSTATLPSVAPITYADMFSSTQVRRLLRFFCYAAANNTSQASRVKHTIFYIWYIYNVFYTFFVSWQSKNIVIQTLPVSPWTISHYDPRRHTGSWMLSPGWLSDDLYAPDQKCRVTHAFLNIFVILPWTSH